MSARIATSADQTRWDAYVAAHPLGTPYHRFAWKEAMEKGYGIKTGYRLAETASGSISGILPVARVPKPMGSGTWCSLPYCDRGEALTDDPDTRDALLASLHGHGQTDRGAGITHEIRATGTADDRSTGDASITEGQKVRMVLDLPDSADALLKGFKSKHRSQINKAKKNGLDVSLGNTPERVENFYKVYTANMRDLGSPPHSLAWFRAIASAYGDDCVIAVVSSEAKAIGAGLVLANPSVAAIPWASTLRNFNRLAPNMLLYWALLSHCVERGYRRFDFGRSSYGEGTYRFKAQWGAMPVPLDWHHFPSRRTQMAASAPHVLDSKNTENHPSEGRLRPLAEATWRRLPIPLTVAVGSRLRKYISL